MSRSQTIAPPVRMTAGGVIVSKAALAAFFVGLAMVLSTFVKYEPAPVDAVIVGLIIALPLLSQSRPGPFSTLVCALMVVMVGVGLVAAPLSNEYPGAVKHLVITLYLVVGAYVIAGFIAARPVERIALFMRTYTWACYIAAGLAIAGFFSLFPGAYDLFTNYGRAKGPFKDPNVLGAAIAPGFVWLVWTAMTSPPRKALFSLLGASVIGFALLVCFSRGAWISTLISLAFMSLFLVAYASTPERKSRLLGALVLGCLILPSALLVALQFEQIQELLSVRFRFDQSYDVGPEGRFGGQFKAIGMILDNPIGIGVFEFSRFHIEEPHNVYLSQFLNGGWLGGFIYIACVALTLIIGLKLCFTPGPLQVPQVLMTAAFIGLVLEGFIIETDHWRHFFFVQAGILGLADGWERAKRQRAAALDDLADAERHDDSVRVAVPAVLTKRPTRGLPVAPNKHPGRAPLATPSIRGTPRPAETPARAPERFPNVPSRNVPRPIEVPATRTIGAPLLLPIPASATRPTQSSQTVPAAANHARAIDSPSPTKATIATTATAPVLARTLASRACTPGPLQRKTRPDYETRAGELAARSLAPGPIARHRGSRRGDRAA
ncbi:MAG: O-antigen ligase family protein [Pseudomonadota bacterium]